jgi:hypothetical protein
MARRKKKKGTCCICGRYSDLSFEHVPPRKAFNDRSLVRRKVDWMREGGPKIDRGGKVEQRGAGEYTLCERCNNITGKWYGCAYVEWAKQGLEAIDSSRGWPAIYYRFKIYPLRVLKQVVCMFLSTNGPGFARGHPDLVRFVLSRDRMHLQPDVRLFAFCTVSPLRRQTGVQLFGRANKAYPLSELTFPPFGYVMFFRCESHDPRLYDISFFGKYAYGERKIVSLPLALLPVFSLYPADYRSPKELHDTIQENIMAEREQKLRSLGERS